MTTSVSTMLRSPFAVITLVVLTWFTVVLLLWPNLNLLIETFFPDGTFSGRAVERLMSSERAMRSLLNSVVLAVALAISTNVVGIFLVLVTSYFKIFGSRVLWLGYATTLIYGGIVLAAGFKFVYGRDGIVTGILLRFHPELDRDWFTGFFAVLIVMTLATTTNHLLFLSSAIAKVDQQTVEAAKNLGASQWTILRRVVLPTVKPMIFAITILSFLTGLGALSAPIVLGGRDFQTITPMILSFAGSPASRDLAALLAIVLGLATIAMLVFLTRMEAGGTYFSLSKVATPLAKQKIQSRAANVVVHLAAYLIFLFYLTPFLLIILYSFVDSYSIQTSSFAIENMSLANYERVLTQRRALQPFLISILYSAAAAGVAVVGLLLVTRVLVRHRNWISIGFEYLLHVPWLLPGAMIALGLIMSYDQPSPLIGNNVLTGTVWILGIAFVVIKVPFTLRLLKASFSSINHSLEEAAVLMGAGTWTIFRRILLPAVLPVAAAVFALNFISLLDDYDTAIFLAHPLYQPLGPVIHANAESSTDLDARANTFVYTVLLMIISTAAMWLAYGGATRRRRRRRPAVAPAAPVTLSSSTKGPL
ncbi:iron ABC transporter permease [Nesterenkonia sp. HG001]|uniref:ABC transporter permease n=1 Tax=Nesterenkonia sp. HG001 TaxID=2983207 RepID=UPI002AC3ECBF|nr:iron ABC transporter permease [Nesterenkonia sp. HG001]MDZ5077264.1 iron ABC transporter permease [Nesterenkonia sp. HG001]